MCKASCSQIVRTIPILIVPCHGERSAAISLPRILGVGLWLLAVVSTATAKYSGGSGTAKDPYQLATAADLIALGETPADYSRCFILTADIDLDPKLPGRKVFDKAVIAPDTDPTPDEDGYNPHSGTDFTGVFDGKGHTISHLTIQGGSYLGLFGQLTSGAEVKNLGVVDVSVTGSGDCVGGLVGYNGGTVAQCYSTGTVKGDSVGGLVGYNGGAVIQCFSTGTVSGGSGVGGLVGGSGGTVTQCYSTGTVSGGSSVGGLAGSNDGHVTQCYSTGSVTGRDYVGGLAGSGRTVTNSYSTGAVSGNKYVGGLLGYTHHGPVTHCYSTGPVTGTDSVGGLVGWADPHSVNNGVWDMGTSGQTGSSGSGEVGLSTGEMMDPYMLGLNGFANDPNWVLDAGRDYPRLAWEGTPGQIIPEARIDWLAGRGTAEEPYRIDTADQLILLRKASLLWDKHFVLVMDINLDPRIRGRQVFGQAVIPVFSGVFDGNRHTISHLTIIGDDYLGLFGQLTSGAEVKDLGVVDVNVVGYSRVGGLVGDNYYGTVIQCYSTGSVSGGGSSVGGLVGWNCGSIATSYSSGSVSGGGPVGGLVGCNEDGDISTSYSSGSVRGNYNVGGMVGCNKGSITASYSSGSVSGGEHVGGLVGGHYNGSVTGCYSTGRLAGESDVGGVVGYMYPWGGWNCGLYCFWDIQTSQTANGSGTGKTTSEMQTAKTFLDAGWDFVGETKNGTHEIWQMPPGGGYPILAIFSGYTPPRLQGSGTAEDPYLVSNALELGAMWRYSPYVHYRLAADIDLSGVRWSTAVIPSLAGTFDGNGHTILHLTIKQTPPGYGGLFGYLRSGAEVKNLGVVDVSVTGSGDCVGGLVGYNSGHVTQCYSTGTVSGGSSVGGLAGSNDGHVTQCYSTGAVSGSFDVGGLVGENHGEVTQCYSTGTVSGGSGVGGLVGRSGGTVTQCYSTGTVSGDWGVGGLVGENHGEVTQCYSTGRVSDTGWNVGGLVAIGKATASFWDIQTSGQAKSAAGTGKTTADMRTAKTFLDAGWDFVGETKNGTEDIWWIDEGKDYPRLWWELTPQK